MKILYAVLILMVLCSGIVYAQNDPMAGGPMPGMQMGMPRQPVPSMDMMGQHMLPMMVQMLGLSDDQIARIQNVFLDFAKIQAKQQSEIQVAQIELFQMLLNDKINRQQIENQAQKLFNLQSQLQLEGVKAALSAQSVLTQAQWSQLVTMLRRMALNPMPGPGAPMPMMGNPGMQGPGAPMPMPMPMPMQSEQSKPQMK